MKENHIQRGRETESTHSGAFKRRQPAAVASPDEVQRRCSALVETSPNLVAQRRSLEAPVARKKNITGMPDDVKSRMERSFDTDFSDVTVHASSSKAPEVGALAYTQGSDIHFAPGQYKPDTTSGRELIGHELAHVVQQREGRVTPTCEVAGMPVNDNPGLEAEADALGRQAARG